MRSRWAMLRGSGTGARKTMILTGAWLQQTGRRVTRKRTCCSTTATAVAKQVRRSQARFAAALAEPGPNPLCAVHTTGCSCCRARAGTQLWRSLPDFFARCPTVASVAQSSQALRRRRCRHTWWRQGSRCAPPCAARLQSLSRSARPPAARTSRCCDPRRPAARRHAAGSSWGTRAPARRDGCGPAPGAPRCGPCRCLASWPCPCLVCASQTCEAAHGPRPQLAVAPSACACAACQRAARPRRAASATGRVATRQAGGTSDLQMLFNSVNALCGIGLLATPFALAEMGWFALVLMMGAPRRPCPTRREAPRGSRAYAGAGSAQVDCTP